ncbi:MAG TPA: 30S ribosomal protein S16, partial [Actinomycetota bacterium]|nr:30S ribosomal protein S16 [Actinomycetota bacterium]
RYQPMSEPSVIEIDEERALHWLGQGAQPSDPVRVLLERVGIWEQFKPGDALRVRQPKPAKPQAPPEPPVEEPVPEPPAAEEAPPESPVEEPVPEPPAAEEAPPEPSEDAPPEQSESSAEEPS